ncbi:MAG: FoF1 ATP synthase subunit gamma [Erysipelothrix sp.]
MPNTSALKKRIKTISSTQKITKAMKLVSLSKLQRYKNELGSFKDYYNAVHEISDSFMTADEMETSSLPKLYFIIMPDLGLCSAYSQGVLKKVREVSSDGDFAYVLGTQNYETLQSLDLKVINKMESSEHFNVNQGIKVISEYLDTHQIIAVVPEYVNMMTMEFHLYELSTANYQMRDDVIYEPNFNEVTLLLKKVSLISLLRFAFLTSKVSEHTTRRIAMEKATDSAQDMIDDLGRQYNRIRQEAITQEISEIVSGMEVS